MASELLDKRYCQRQVVKKTERVYGRPSWADVPDDGSYVMAATGVPAQASASADGRLRDMPTPVSDVTAAVAADMDDIVDEWGRQSFPASDPPANW